jgi:uncharacterized protein YqjF (DUF2071 family)
MSSRTRRILEQTAHRPWPLPSGPWIMAQSWHNLLFAHWPVDAARWRQLIPKQLAVDTFEEQAWLGIVPFYMTGVRPRCIPRLPWLSSFAELNVRTYVTAEGKPGVWFFSLDATNYLVVAAARATFHLPYFTARMSCEEKDGWVNYESERTHKNAPGACFEGKYRARGDVFEARRGSLEHFLTERYCLYSAAPNGRVYRGEIHHPPWQLQAAEAESTRNTMADAAGVILPRNSPLLHFARRQDMVAWAPKPIA